MVFGELEFGGSSIMPFSKELGECLCMRCGHWWKPKPDDNGEYSEPKSCAKCKSKVWNKSRKYNLGTLESTLIVHHREKLTGRAAAKAKKVEDKNFKEYETLVIADKKKLKIDLRLATENGLWYVGHRIESGTYGSFCGPSRNKYRTAYGSREEAIVCEIKDIVQFHSCYPEIIKAGQVFLDNWRKVVSVFEQFKPTLKKLQSEGFRSGGYDYWKSRWYEFVRWTGNETKDERKVKHELELLFPDVWQNFKSAFTEIK